MLNNFLKYLRVELNKIVKMSISFRECQQSMKTTQSLLTLADQAMQVPS